jgi:hypothetical protein
VLGKLKLVKDSHLVTPSDPKAVCQRYVWCYSERCLEFISSSTVLQLDRRIRIPTIYSEITAFWFVILVYGKPSVPDVHSERVDIFGRISLLLQPSEAAPSVREERKRTERQKPYRKSQFSTGENKQHHQQLVALN